MLRLEKFKSLENEVKVTLKQIDTDALLEYLKADVAPKDQLTDFSKPQLLSIAINMFAPYAYFILVRLRSTNEYSLTTQSADLFFDL